MMTRNYYENVDLERYRRHQYPIPQWETQRNAPLELSHADRQQMRSAPICRPERILPENEGDSQGGNSQTRRQRIAVACARCRKRKIKCSGDPGNGLGCGNCRNSGSETCNFFRVGSYEPSLSNDQQLPAGLNGYMPSSAVDRMGFVTVPAPPPYGYSASRTYQQTQMPLSITTRNLAPSSDYSLHCDSESPNEPGYGLQSTPLTPHESYATYAVQDNGRSWVNVPQRIPTSYPSYVEPDASAGYTSSQLPYASTVSSRHPPSQPMSAGDNTSAFNVVSLQYSLPTTAPDRILPNPMPNPIPRSYYPASAHNMNVMSHRINGLGISNVSDHGFTSSHAKRPGTWVSEHPMANTRSDSTSSVTSVVDLVAPPPSKASTPSTSSVLGDSPLSYAASATSPEAPSINPAASTYTCAPSGYSVGSGTSVTPRALSTATSCHNLHIPASNSIPSSNALTRALRQDSRVNMELLYSYSKDHTARRNSMNEIMRSEGILVNNDTYTPLAQPQPDRAANINNFRLGSCNSGPTLIHQSSRHSMNQNS